LALHRLPYDHSARVAPTVRLSGLGNLFRGRLFGAQATSTLEPVAQSRAVSLIHSSAYTISS
jgi:hypothetical protein